MRANNHKHLTWLTLAVLICGLSAAPASAAKTVLRLWLTGAVAEAPSEDADFAVIFGGEKPRTLYQWVESIHKAAESDDIAGLVLIIDSPQIGLAQTEELRRAIKDFRATGKKAHAYLDYAGNASYALATAADDITIAEHSELAIMGLAAEMSYYKNLFDKIGVKADMLHCGDYKSAVEPYTRTEPSGPAAEQMNWLLDGIFDRLVNIIAEGRGLSADDVRAAIDAAPLSAEKALERKLVDRIAGFPEFRDLLHKEYGADVVVKKTMDDDDGLKIDFENPFAIFEFFSDVMDKAAEEKEPGIGLIYIEGAITTGKSQNSLMGGSSAGSTTLRAAFTKALEDDNIKAVVVRVNSPGGSALASDIMWDAETRLGKEKPLIVSMSNVAGSGGYYVAIPGSVIFAEASTITGSIGVLGGKLVWNELMEDKLGITTTMFTRGKQADLFSMNHEFTDEQRVLVQEYMDEVYAQFKGRVMTSRGDRIKGELDKLAGGRVYTGEQALEIGLIDKIGGLTDAINFAAAKAGLKDPEIYILPKQKDFAEVLMSLFDDESEDEFEIGLPQGMTRDPLVRAMLPVLREMLADRAESVLYGWSNLMIINDEHVGCFMPFSGKLH
ncbi:MAG: S49 family peptidase [Phycisphaerae bacterium]|nr:S49 family peptidase [Phycisphaerae bacterium]